MSDDLIKRLHSCEYAAYYDGEPGIVADENLLHEAADRIEALQADRQQAAAEERAKIVALAAEWMGDIEFAQFKHVIETDETFTHPDNV